jgi:membrane protein YdbS with pleckstrin-like domain
MTMSRSGYRRRSGLGAVMALILILWFIIGAIAAGQRHYYSGSPSNCAHTGTVIVTILAGPLNYVGANPKISCHVPQPSK